MSEKNSVSKSTLYVAVGISLIAGFLGGVVYTIYNAPAPVTTTANMQQQAQAPPLSAKIARLEQESKKHPDDPAVWESLGHAYFDSNLTAQAIQAYNKSLELRPQSPDLLTDLGVMYRRNSQPEKAVVITSYSIHYTKLYEKTTMTIQLTPLPLLLIRQTTIRFMLQPAGGRKTKAQCAQAATREQAGTASLRVFPRELSGRLLWMKKARKMNGFCTRQVIKTESTNPLTVAGAGMQLIPGWEEQTTICR